MPAKTIAGIFHTASVLDAGKCSGVGMPGVR